MDFKGKSTSEIIGKAIGSLITGLLIVIAIKLVFFLTWPQAYVLGWLYCMLRDACLSSKG